MTPEKRSQPRVFVVLGDGLAAGAGPGRLGTAARRSSFPARVARRLGVAFAYPPPSPAAVFRQRGGTLLPPHHLGVPRFRFRDALEKRPVPPLLQPEDPLMEETNLVLGLPSLLERRLPPTLLEAAAAHRPTHALVCLGFDEAVTAARLGDPGKLPSDDELEGTFEPLQVALGRARLVVTTIPDPSACPALFTLIADPEPLRTGLRRLNDKLRQLAEGYGAALFELDRLWPTTPATGRQDTTYHEHSAATAGPFFGTDGVYPSPAGHRLLATELLRQLEEDWGLDLLGTERPQDIPRPPEEPTDGRQPSRSAASAENRGGPRSSPLQRKSPEGGLRLKIDTPQKATQQVAMRGEDEPDAPGEGSDLTLEIDAEGSFCQLALLSEPSAGRRSEATPGLERLLGGPALGLAPLQGVVSLRLGAPDAEGRCPMALELPAPLSAQGGSVGAPCLLEASLDSLELHGHDPLFGTLDPRTGRASLVAGELRLASAFTDQLAADHPGLRLVSSDVWLELPERSGAAPHVDLRWRLTWRLGVPAYLPTHPPLKTTGAMLSLYLRLTTRGSEAQPQPQLRLDPGVQELTVLASLEGRYDLAAPPLGGAGEDHRWLVGRLRLETGPPSGDLVPALVRFEPPTPATPERGLLGFDGDVRFPGRVWRRRLPSLAESGPPSLAVIDRASGDLLGGLHLSMRSNGLPAKVECLFHPRARLWDEDSHLRLELLAESAVELAEGTPYRLSGAQDALIGPSRVDLRLRLEASGDLRDPAGTLSGEERLLSTGRQLFTFRYVLPTTPGERTLFEYVNHTRPGTFQLICPIRLRFSRSPGSRPARLPDTAVLEGMGTWTGKASGRPGRLHHVFFLLRRARGSSYVAILIDGGRTSGAEAGSPDPRKARKTEGLW